ncbi:MAG: DNA-3-methyladenine glycosylase [Eubacterium sp.]|jgi:DNA-3-methyladenine glycosylase|nr:DNA-3-methyladenine glycosylase [Eubacterium sp.]
MRIKDKNFFLQTALEGAPALLGKLICRKTDNGTTKLRITETECYMGEEDKACHASKGKTPRTSVLYSEGGVYYVYLIYGIHNLLNVVFGQEGVPQAVLIRCCEGHEGPGKLTRRLGITRNFNKSNALTSDELWLEDDGFLVEYETKPRVGIDYAGEYWRDIPWRFVLNQRYL